MSRAYQILQNEGSDTPPSLAVDAHQNVDALFQGREAPPPSALILDYVYSVAAYNTWRSTRGDVSSIMNDYHEKRYADILPPPHPPDDNDNSPELGDPDPPRRYISATRRDESRLAKAVDELKLFMMDIHGITPEEAAKRRGGE